MNSLGIRAPDWLRLLSSIRSSYTPQPGRTCFQPPYHWSLTGAWTADNDTVNGTIPLVDTWTFTHAVSLTQHDIVEACYRPKSIPWYLQPFPTWTAFVIVPVFSLFSSLAKLQPLKSKQLPVMVGSDFFRAARMPQIKSPTTTSPINLASSLPSELVYTCSAPGKTQLFSHF
ncbi:uncharacterized protein BT62DRAFT_660289 [Guyanagaster necrorhizus]|uniref:Uncharacterized protein n=1 Tax=Guyanagaster necrorhizus TaxID=856835 RepID=A0A9P7VZD4_9AGAR|nr:uncharacterized protein BT62DRAFT_660289 [Guyanagaster necrorhizus MCA 3950]KAG7449054.1 hypothetical protein BT62DRAFT_660289 [Guyanagaster necrorhizus MCA 3950]